MTTEEFKELLEEYEEAVYICEDEYADKFKKQLIEAFDDAITPVAHLLEKDY